MSPRSPSHVPEDIHEQAVPGDSPSPPETAPRVFAHAAPRHATRPAAPQHASRPFEVPEHALKDSAHPAPAAPQHATRPLETPEHVLKDSEHPAPAAPDPVPADSASTSLVLTPEILARLAAVAEAHGLLRLGAVRLDHPGFALARAALDRYLAAGKAGDMEFLPRTAAVRKRPEAMLPGARTLLVAAVPYAGEPGPIARYARPRDYHTIVHQRLIALEAALHVELPGVRTLICVDTKPVLERSAAALAGLGFLGKHGCLIVPGLGSYVLLGEILCTATWPEEHTQPAPTGAPWDACGACTRCLDACPTAAFDAPGALDPRRCISYLTIEHRGHVPKNLSEKFGERIAGCDVCQEVCPYNAGTARLERIPAAAWLPPNPRRTPSVPAMAAIGAAQYRAFVRHTALRRIPHRLMRRNALIALGNRTGPPDPDERYAFAAGLLEPDPRVHEAARWALQRRGLDEASLAPELAEVRARREALAAAASCDDAEPATIDPATDPDER